MSTTSITFSSSGTWVCPIGVRSVQVECWGAGGFGAYGKGLTTTGDGGGGGAYAKANSAPVTPGVSYAFTVGTASTDSSIPSGFSRFGTNPYPCYAGGGNGGFDGAPGQAVAGDVLVNGGSGGFHTGGGNGGGGGGGGCGNGSSGDGSSNSGGTGGAGGAGANGGGTGGKGGNSHNVGVAGTGIGAGGGAGGVNAPGATGTNGQVKLTWTLPMMVQLTITD